MELLKIWNIHKEEFENSKCSSTDNSVQTI